MLDESLMSRDVKLTERDNLRGVAKLHTVLNCTKPPSRPSRPSIDQFSTPDTQIYKSKSNMGSYDRALSGEYSLFTALHTALHKTVRLFVLAG